MSLTRIFSIAMVVAFMAGCAGNKVKETPEIAPVLDGGASSQGVGTNTGTANPMDSGVYGDVAGPSGDLLSTRVIYFDYDSAQVRPEFVAVVNAHGRNLADNPNARIRLEGHADERGSREYNIALSEYRAEAVRNLMKFQGVRQGQVETVAFGEEKPIELGHNETAWSRNRRVEIVYEAE